jgi:signal transduction histidine kinase
LTAFQVAMHQMTAQPGMLQIRCSRPGETMSESEKKSLAELERELEELQRADVQTRRQVALLRGIIRIFRETPACRTEEQVAQLGLKVAEELSGSAIGFIGELNPAGHFDTTTLSEAGWKACRVPRAEAGELLRNMPNRGFLRAGMQEGKSWIVNDPASHPATVEKPRGHPRITAFLGVPLRFMGGVTGMIGLANKQGGYSNADQLEIEALSVAFVEALNRLRAERKIQELNQQLQAHLHRAEAANKELEAFSYSVSHDLRAPLRHITGFVELLNKRDIEALDEKSRHYLQVISAAAQKMGALIDDLLAFSRMGRAEMMRTKVDLGRMVEEIIADVAEDAQGREVAWQVAPLPVVTGDKAMLRLALVNYITNALKFTRPVSRARIEIGAVTDHPEETRIYIRDNGVGFDMRYRNKLFGLFQRLHGPEEFEGTGVGLANVRRIIHRHGGRTWAEGEVGGGATFWFSLPKSEEK